MIVVKLSNDIIIGNEVNLFIFIGILMLLLMINFMLVVVINRRNKLILIFVLWVMLEGRLCKI